MYLKQETMKLYATPDTRTFVEAGTYLGETVAQAVQSGLFDTIYSIELSSQLARAAKEKFRSVNNVEIIEGDSSVVFPALLKFIEGRAMFWLDAHWSKGFTALGPKVSSVTDELEALAHHPVKNHTIMIDDMRYMTLDEGYFGATKDQLIELIKRINPEYKIEFIEPLRDLGPQVLLARV